MLHISRSAYYKWNSGNLSPRQKENEEIADKLEQMHLDEPEKGYRRLRDDLEIYHGIPVNDKRVLRICRKLGIKSAIKYASNRDELYFSKNGRVTTISGAFKDEHTCSVTVTQNAGRLGRENHFIAEFRADPDLLQIEVTDDTEEKLFEASLYHAEKGGMEFLYDEENAVELTPELADSILHGRPEETVSQAEAVITE